MNEDTQKVLQAPYYQKTRDGDRIVERLLNRTGEMIVIVEEETPFLASRGGESRRYNMGNAYDVFHGTWAGQGAYGFKTKREAIDAAFAKDFKPAVCHFDIDNPADVAFYLDSKFNYNQVGTDFLRYNSHRAEGYDPYRGWTEHDSRKTEYENREYFDSERKRLRLRNDKPKFFTKWKRKSDVQ